MIRAIFDNKSHDLRPGMFANVAVIAGTPQKVITVPKTAVTYSLYGDAVFVVVPAESELGRSAGAPDRRRHSL